MPFLHLTIRWLADEAGQPAYHGGEWPPSPARLFRALLAGAGRPGGAGERGRQALQRLESLAPPRIQGPIPERLAPVRTAVPNNDGDKVMEHYHKGEPDRARKKQSSQRTMRLRQGWSVPGPVEYRWHFPEPDPDPEAFELLADGLTLLGQGTDLAYAGVAWQESEQPLWGYVWKPDEAGGNEAMPVPSQGEVGRMDQLYEASRQRIHGGHVSGMREPSVALAAYQDPLTPPSKQWQAFSLRLPDDRGPWSVPGEEAMRVTGMVRHALDQAARQAGLDDSVIRALMGHDGPGRIQVLPVPNVGHDWADGRIRRVLLATPPAVEPATRDAVLLRMTGAELIQQETKEVQGLLAPIPEPSEDKVLWRFTEAACRWSSANPVILPGFDSRRGRSRPGKAVRRLLKHAGIPQEAVRAVRMDDVPRLPGVSSAAQIAVPHYLRDYPRKYLTIEFHKPVAGPIILGAGEGTGIGLLTRSEHLSVAQIPGRRSQAEICITPDS